MQGVIHAQEDINASILLDLTNALVMFNVNQAMKLTMLALNVMVSFLLVNRIYSLARI